MTVVPLNPTHDTPDGLNATPPSNDPPLSSNSALWADAERQLHQLLHTVPEVQGPGSVAVLTPFGMARSQVRWLDSEHTWHVRVHAPFFDATRDVVEGPAQAVAGAWQELGLAYTTCYTHARNQGATLPAECWAGAARQAFLAAVCINPHLTP